MRTARVLVLAWIAWALALRADVWRRERVGHPKGHLIVDRPRWYPPRRLRRNRVLDVVDVRRGELDVGGHVLTVRDTLNLSGTGVASIRAAGLVFRPTLVEPAGDWT